MFSCISLPVLIVFADLSFILSIGLAYPLCNPPGFSLPGMVSVLWILDYCAGSGSHLDHRNTKLQRRRPRFRACALNPEGVTYQLVGLGAGTSLRMEETSGRERQT